MLTHSSCGLSGRAALDPCGSWLRRRDPLVYACVQFSFVMEIADPTMLFQGLCELAPAELNSNSLRSGRPRDPSDVAARPSCASVARANRTNRANLEDGRPHEEAHIVSHSAIQCHKVLDVPTGLIAEGNPTCATAPRGRAVFAASYPRFKGPVLWSRLWFARISCTEEMTPIFGSVVKPLPLIGLAILWFFGRLVISGCSSATSKQSLQFARVVGN